MSLMWLACYHDGSYRPSGTSRRRRVGVPTVPWFVNKLEKTFGSEGADSIMYNRGARSVMKFGLEVYVVAMVHVSSRGCVDSTSALGWRPESLLQHEYYGHPKDAYEMHVEDFAELIKPERLSFRTVGRTRHEKIAKVNCSIPYFAGRWPLNVDLANVPVASTQLPTTSIPSEEFALNEKQVEEVEPLSAQIGYWDIEAGDLVQTPVLMMPWPIVALLLQGEWQKLMVCTNWHKHAYAEQELERWKSSFPDRSSPVPSVCLVSCAV